MRLFWTLGVGNSGISCSVDDVITRQVYAMEGAGIGDAVGDFLQGHIGKTKLAKGGAGLNEIKGYLER